MKPICVPCQRFFLPKKTGFYFLEGMPIGTDVVPGKRMDNYWEPYKLWCGDLWECPDCKAQMIVGTGREPIAEHYEANFNEQVAQHEADQFKVNDC